MVAELEGHMRTSIESGTDVDVLVSFDGEWSHGFRVEEASADTYRIRRMSDGTMLPGLFSKHEVRRTKQGFRRRSEDRPGIEG